MCPQQSFLLMVMRNVTDGSGRRRRASQVARQGRLYGQHHATIASTITGLTENCPLFLVRIPARGLNDGPRFNWLVQYSASLHEGQPKGVEEAKCMGACPLIFWLPSLNTCHHTSYKFVISQNFPWQKDILSTGFPAPTQVYPLLLDRDRSWSSKIPIYYPYITHIMLTFSYCFQET
ncbi:hypothetical protein BDW60DRAFT_75330 [Aspergillus nidulans var. acristatus]